MRRGPLLPIRSPLLRRRNGLVAPSRRGLFRMMGGAAASLPFAPLLLPRTARAGVAKARRVIFFHMPDGVPDAIGDGGYSRWHGTGSEHDFELGECLEPLEEWRDRCLFFNNVELTGLPMHAHRSGYYKLLTATDYGQGRSIDQVIGDEIGAADPWRSVYLGCQAADVGASGYDHIVYPVEGVSMPPEDNPGIAHELLFGHNTIPRGTRSRLDSVLSLAGDDLLELRADLGTIERDKLDYHIDSLSALEIRLERGRGQPDPVSSPWSIPDVELYKARTFPSILSFQSELMCLAMEAGLTRVGVIQSSAHRHQLDMSKFEGEEFYSATGGIGCHEASHYGGVMDESNDYFAHYLMHRKWWVSRYADILAWLDSRPEDDGTMLDYSIVVLMSDVSEPNSHSHYNMPFLVAGGAGGAWSTGRLLDGEGYNNGHLWMSIAKAMGVELDSFGDHAEGTFPGMG